MRILPDLKWLNYKDYKKKVFGEQLIAELKSRYQGKVLRHGRVHWQFENMPNKYMKMSLGNSGFHVPRHEWDKLKYRFGKMSKVKG